MTSAELCRANGWVVGDVLEADWIYGPTRVQLTAIGEELILGRLCGKESKPPESAFFLGGIEWHKVGDPTTKGGG